MIVKAFQKYFSAQNACHSISPPLEKRPPPPSKKEFYKLRETSKIQKEVLGIQKIMERDNV